MEAASVYVKTPGGRAEVRSREHRLSPRERATLIMIDGQRCLAELRRLSPAPDEVEHHLRAFLDAGLIAPLSHSLRGSSHTESACAQDQAAETEADSFLASTPRVVDNDLEKVRLYVLEVAQEILGAEVAEFSHRLAQSDNARELLSLAHHLREVLNRFTNAKEADQFWETVREIAPKA